MSSFCFAFVRFSRYSHTHEERINNEWGRKETTVCEKFVQGMVTHPPVLCFNVDYQWKGKLSIEENFVSKKRKIWVFKLLKSSEIEIFWWFFTIYRTKYKKLKWKSKNKSKRANLSHKKKGNRICIAEIPWSHSFFLRNVYSRNSFALHSTPVWTYADTHSFSLLVLSYP